MQLSLPAIGSFTTVDGIRYTVEPGPAFPDTTVCWNGGARGGTVYVNYLNRLKGLVDETHPYKTYRGSSNGVSHRTFVQAALSAQKWAKHRYDEAKRFAAAYDAEMNPPIDREAFEVFWSQNQHLGFKAAREAFREARRQEVR